MPPGPLHVKRLEAVALPQSVRKDRLGLEAAVAEDRQEERGAGDPVDVVVAHHGDALAPLPGGGEAAHGPIHAG